MSDPVLLTPAEVMALLGYTSPETFARIRQRPGFPPPVYVTDRHGHPKWIKARILKWIESLDAQAQERA